MNPFVTTAARTAATRVPAGVLTPTAAPAPVRYRSSNDLLAALVNKPRAKGRVLGTPAPRARARRNGALIVDFTSLVTWRRRYFKENRVHSVHPAAQAAVQNPALTGTIEMAIRGLAAKGTPLYAKFAEDLRAVGVAEAAHAATAKLSKSFADVPWHTRDAAAFDARLAAVRTLRTLSLLEIKGTALGVRREFLEGRMSRALGEMRSSVSMSQEAAALAANDGDSEAREARDGSLSIDFAAELGIELRGTSDNVAVAAGQMEARELLVTAAAVYRLNTDEFMAAVAQTLGQRGAIAALVEAGGGLSEDEFEKRNALTEDERVAADKRRYSRISKAKTTIDMETVRETLVAAGA